MQYESEVIGKEGITARVVQASASEYTGTVMWTLEIEYPRFILAELNTHCMLEKNSSSSRAVPVAFQSQLLLDNPAMPVYWGKNQSGMTAKEELNDLEKEAAKGVWLQALKDALSAGNVLSDKAGLNVHKQITNRITEFGQRMRTVISGTEWANFFWLRNHPDAQPEFQELARVMLEAMQRVTPKKLKAWEWHVPYVERVWNYSLADDQENLLYFVPGTMQQLSLEEALKVSVSCCAQTSYRKQDDSLEKAEEVFKRLNIGSSTQPAHASPCTHQAKPIAYFNGIDDYEQGLQPENWEEGITHMTRDKRLWSGKLKDFIQYRKLIPNEAKW